MQKSFCRVNLYSTLTGGSREEKMQLEMATEIADADVDRMYRRYVGLDVDNEDVQPAPLASKSAFFGSSA